MQNHYMSQNGKHIKKLATEKQDLSRNARMAMAVQWMKEGTALGAGGKTEQNVQNGPTEHKQ